MFYILLSATKSHWVILFTSVFRDRIWRLTLGRRESGSGRVACQGRQECGGGQKSRLCLIVQATQPQHSQSHSRWHGLQWALRMKPGLDLLSLGFPEGAPWVAPAPADQCLANQWFSSPLRMVPLWVSHHGASFREKSSMISGLLKFYGISNILCNFTRVRLVIRLSGIFYERKLNITCAWIERWASFILKSSTF